MPIQKNKIGHIEVICGPMFSGKTEELIRRINRIEYTNSNIKVFKPNIDKRYSKDSIVSHNGRKIKCIIVSNNKEILSYIDNTDIFAFDEAQFLDSSIIEICKNLVLHNGEIYISRIFYDESWNTFHGTSRINWRFIGFPSTKNVLDSSKM